MTKEELYYQKMTKTPIAKLVLMLGIPTTVSMLITNLYNLVDTYFVGTLGESQQAATGILFTLQCIIQAIAFMLGQGSGAFVSKCLADKDSKKASNYVSSAFFIGGFIGILLMAGGLIFLDPFMKLLGSTNTILPYAKDYGMWVLISCPFMICSLVLNNNLRYEGLSFVSMIGLGTGALINIFGDYYFVSQLNMGVYGAGLATATSQIISFFILLIFYITKAKSKISIKHISTKIKLYIEVCLCGLPSLIRQGLTSISSGILNNLTKAYGDAAIAAMSIVNRYSSFVLCVGLGIGQGFQPVVAFNYQAKEYKRVKKSMLFTLRFGLIAVGTLALVGLIFPEQIIRMFQKKEEVIAIGKYALIAASIGTMFLPISVTTNMLYQSIRKSTIASFLSLLRSGLAFIPTLLLLSSLFNLKGIQTSQPVADILSSLISIPFMLYFLFKTPNSIEEEKNVAV